MAIQYPDFRADNDAVPQIGGLPYFTTSIEKGYNLAQLPEKLKMEKMLKQAELERQKGQRAYQQAQLQRANLENQYYPEEEENRINLLRTQAEKANQPQNPYSSFTGDVGNAFRLQQLKEESQKNPALLPYYQKAQAAFDSQQASRNSLMDYRNVLNSFADKRYSTQLGKEYSEIEEIKNGFIPGTNGQRFRSPEEQEAAIGQYQNKLLKNTTDYQTRQRNIFVQNLDKTLETIDPKILTQYSGFKGGATKLKEKGLSQFGKESKDYDSYLNNLTSATIAAKQLRQFLGDSVQPSAQSELDKLTNPETWAKNPKQALSQFKQFVNVYNKEKTTYQKALKSPAAYGTEETNDFSHLSDAELEAIANGGNR